jgi:hypothetical protein
MTNAPSTNAQQQASFAALERKDWKRPVLDVLALANAEHGQSHVHDAVLTHKSG